MKSKEATNLRSKMLYIVCSGHSREYKRPTNRYITKEKPYKPNKKMKSSNYYLLIFFELYSIFIISHYLVSPAYHVTSSYFFSTSGFYGCNIVLLIYKET